MKKMKRISIIWGIVALLLFTSLTVIGLMYKSKTEKYKNFERVLVEATKTYTATDFNFPVNGENIVIKMSELEEANLLSTTKVEDHECSGYVIVSFKNVTEYKAYVSCDKYTTHGFEKKNLE